MVIVAGTFEIEPDERDAFLASRHEGMRRSRAEAGNLDYVFSADPLDPSRVVLFELWEDQDSLDAHLAALRSNPPGLPRGPKPLSSKVVMYDAVPQSPAG